MASVFKRVAPRFFARRWWVVATIALTAGWSGCGSDDPSTPGLARARALEPVAEEAFAGEVARVVCDAIGPCCTQQARPFVRAGCEAAAAAEAAVIGAQQPAMTAYDGVAARRCLGLLEVAMASCELTEGVTSRLDEACAAAFGAKGCPGGCFATGSAATAQRCGAP